MQVNTDNTDMTEQTFIRHKGCQALLRIELVGYTAPSGLLSTSATSARILPFDEVEGSQIARACQRVRVLLSQHPLPAASAVLLVSLIMSVGSRIFLKHKWPAPGARYLRSDLSDWLSRVTRVQKVQPLTRRQMPFALPD